VTPLRLPRPAAGSAQIIEVTLTQLLDSKDSCWPNPEDEVESIIWTASLEVIDEHGIYIEKPNLDNLVFLADNLPNCSLRATEGSISWAITRPWELAAFPKVSAARTRSRAKLLYATSELESEKEIRWDTVPVGWRCYLCNLGDLGGEEELAAHYDFCHHGECWLDKIRTSRVSLEVVIERHINNKRFQDDEYERIVFRVRKYQQAGHGFPTPESLIDDLNGGGDPHDVLDVDSHRDMRKGLAGPIMKDRRNSRTEWSHRVVPNTLADLMPELDALFDGGKYRHVMRYHEEVSVPSFNLRPLLNETRRISGARLQ
jgi:hypothetical protein